MTEPVVRLSGVTKVLGDHTAVSDLDLEIQPGAMYGLLGPNGSGKTTAIRMMMSILLPDQGEVRLFGKPPDFKGRSRIGYLPETRGVYPKMKVLEQLRYLGEIRGLSGREAGKRSRRWLEEFGLAEWAGRKVQDLSKGMQQKVQFIGTVLHNPEFLILDEPFSGLDPINQDLLESIVRRENDRGATVLFSTHLMDQAERLCERVCLISASRKVLDGKLKDLKRNERSGAIAVEFEDEAPEVRWPGVARIERDGDVIRLTLDERGSPQEVLAAAAGSGGRLRRFEVLEPRLHEIFVRHAGGEARGAGARA